MRSKALILLIFTSCTTLPTYNYFNERRGMTFQDYFSHTDILELWPAISKNDSILLRKLIDERKIDVNLKGKNNVTILHWLIGNLDRASVEVVLSAGADPDSICYEDTTPLGIAILVKDIELIRLLGRYKANFNFELPENRYGAHSPRHPIAFLIGESPEILKALIFYGADPNYYKTAEGLNIYEYNFLYAALLVEDYNEAIILLQAGADPFISESVKTEIIKFFQKFNSQKPNFIEVKDILKEMGLFDGANL